MTGCVLFDCGRNLIVFVCVCGAAFDLALASGPRLRFHEYGPFEA